MKKLCANLLLLPVLPVILAAFSWTLTRAAWHVGLELAELIGDWFNSK